MQYFNEQAKLILTNKRKRQLENVWRWEVYICVQS